MHSLTAGYRGRFKYDSRTATAYQQVDPDKHQAEMRLVDRVLSMVPPAHRVLDLPCGGGRLSLHVSQRGYQVTAADLSDAMIAIAGSTLHAHGLTHGVDKQDIEHTTYADRAFDTVFSFRLFHHFPNADIRQRAVSELCRISGRYVAMSYFSPWSVTSIKRRIRVLRGGRPSEKHSTSLSEVEAYFARAGFRLVRDFARSPFIHTLHLALFERIEA